MVPYQPVFDDVVKLVADKITFGAHMPDTASLDQDLEAKRGEIEELESRISDLLDSFERTGSAAFEKRVLEREAELKTLKEERDELISRIEEGKDPGDPEEAYERFVEWYHTPVTGDEIEQMRYQSVAQIASEIAKRVERVEIARENRFAEIEINIVEREDR